MADEPIRGAGAARVTRGLVIREPWIGLILSGEKMWEMRSTAAAFRGPFGLIRKGSGTVVGVARLADVGARLSIEEMVATADRHRIPEATIRSGQVGGWTVPWVLADVRALARPVPYEHRAGAVTWVRFDAAVSDAIAVQSIERTESGSVTEAKNVMLGETVLTIGNLRPKNSHIPMRGFATKFPHDLIGGRDSEPQRLATVEADGLEPVRTDIAPGHLFFRDRTWTRRFFETTGAAPGDRVRVEETGPYRYRVSLRAGRVPSDGQEADRRHDPHA